MEEKKELAKEENSSEEEVKNNQAQLTEQDTQYKLYGYDILTADPLIRRFYEATMSVLGQANLLVGDFDGKGNYIIAKEIKRDIVVMDKEIEEMGENFYKAASLYMKKNFYFYISLSKMPEGKAKAKLYLYEYVGDFLDKDFIISHIANYVDDFNEEFRVKVRKAFNLVDVDVPNNDFETPNLAIRMQRMIDEQVRAEDLYEMACQIFVLRMLKCLEKYSKGKEIVEEFKKLLAKNKGKLTFAKQKAMLDRMINKYGGYEKILKENPEAKTLLEDFIKAYQDIEKSRTEVKAEEISAPKEEKTKAVAGKSGGKSGGGKKPAAKKPAAKKSAKKKAKKEEKKDDKKKTGGGVSDGERKKFADEANKKYGLTKSDQEKEDKKKTPQVAIIPKDKDEKTPEQADPPAVEDNEDEFDDLLQVQSIQAEEEARASTPEVADPVQSAVAVGGIDREVNTEETSTSNEDSAVDVRQQEHERTEIVSPSQTDRGDAETRIEESLIQATSEENPHLDVDMFDELEMS